MRYLYCLLFGCLILASSGCDNKQEEPVKADVMGWAPIYGPDSLVRKIASDTPHSTIHAGKIYAKDHFIYQNEVNEGIHVIDISDPHSPEKIAFIRVSGSTELAIKGHYLYTNNLNDLVVIDIADPHHVHEISRIKNGFNRSYGLYPPDHGYFECVDPSKGAVIGWEKKLLHHPTCVR